MLRSWTLRRRVDDTLGLIGVTIRLFTLSKAMSTFRLSRVLTILSLTNFFLISAARAMPRRLTYFRTVLTLARPWSAKMFLLRSLGKGGIIGVVLASRSR